MVDQWKLIVVYQPGKPDVDPAGKRRSGTALCDRARSAEISPGDGLV
jgi:hypothetical protein